MAYAFPHSPPARATPLITLPVSVTTAVRPGWRARLALDFALDGSGRTRMRATERLGPLSVQKALYPEGDICHALLLHPPGGMVGGDDLRLAIHVQSGAHALLTTPGAGKWYRSLGATSRFDLNFRVAPGAVFEYLPQEAIVFDGAQGASVLNVDLAGDARYIGWDIVTLGRRASGDAFTRGRLDQTIRITRDGVPRVNEVAAYIGGDRALVSPLGLAGRQVVGTLFASGAGVTQALAAVRAALAATLDGAAGLLTGASAWDDVLVVRVLGDCTQRVRATLTAAWAALRLAWLGMAAVPPRIWNT
jgi:urease accessory protein